MLEYFKSGKGKTAVKQYFLKGKIPDFEMFAGWENSGRHVDLFMFLWLHPSWDECVLKPLRDAYMSSGEILIEDLNGIGLFLDQSIVMACTDLSRYHDQSEVLHIIHTDGHNELLFKIMMGDLNQTEEPLVKKRDVFSTSGVYHLPESQLEYLVSMSEWLCIKEMQPINNDMLYQYDQPLEWWYQSCPKNEKYFFKQAQQKAHREMIEMALWRIHNFNDEKEGPGPRTTFVHKMRKILDERPFIKEFETMWQRVKAGEIIISKPWVIY